MTQEEVNAAGYYIGLSDLGLLGPMDKAKLKKKIEAENWKGVVFDVQR
jgi:hypothetical protein